MALMEGLAVGRIVHYVLEGRPGLDAPTREGQERPAIVVRDWQQENGLVNLQVFTDGWNDDFKDTHLVRIGEQDAVVIIHQNSIWRTSVHYSEDKEPGTWHWPERVL
jgi:hypothetical protein